MKQNDDLGRALEAIDNEAHREAEIDAFRANFEQTKKDFFQELQTAIVTVNETPTDEFKRLLEGIVEKYFVVLLTPQQIELKKAVLDGESQWDISTEQILKKLLENYG